jgi:excisionase family DNA binding protein
VSDMMTIQEVSEYLEVSTNDVQGFVDNGELAAFRLGGAVLRFREEHVQSFRRKLYSEKMVKDVLSRTRHATFSDRTVPGRIRFEHPRELKYTFLERLEDFLYYHDFYVLSLIFLILIVAVFFGV